MRFRGVQNWFPRDAAAPNDYEDACAYSEKLGRAVIADGVSSAIFSRTWARLLTRHALALPPRYDDDATFMKWLGLLQRSWADNEAVKRARGDWVRGPKIRSTGGQATFLILDIEPLEATAKRPTEYRLRVAAIGDSVFYLIRDGVKILSFPLKESAEFAQPPHVLSSIAKDVPYVSRFQDLEETVREGDLLVLCTDAIGKWSMQEYEAGVAVDWLRYWDNAAAWQSDVQRLRAMRSHDPGNRLVVDDCTLLLLKVVAEEISELEPLMAPDPSDSPFVLLAPPEEPRAEMQEPAEKPFEEAVEKPAEKLAEKVGETRAEKHAEKPEDKAAAKPECKPEDTPVEKTSAKNASPTVDEVCQTIDEKIEAKVRKIEGGVKKIEGGVKSLLSQLFGGGPRRDDAEPDDQA